MHLQSVAISLAEFLGSFFNGWSPTMERDVQGALIILGT